ncbi:hypothetical protein [Nocardia cyriacigeorgica]|uniref:hypothetical protein n=1 Tax=Nocardia cyriacigeorgica TaxID=135487 RepID=UPI0018935933|nr:hypothetical protein [Nocardia cyriacigeorgica]MBF6439546.1 hypothetical protein [Nocardia cyriacigeorgica]
MSEYSVTWQIDVTADNPVHAAHAALAVQRDPYSTATVFDITDEHGTTHRIDLQDDPAELTALPTLTTPPLPRWAARLMPRRHRANHPRRTR